ncbi:hypothetical protein M501DRAFT_1013840 [Patellaria atrata CBS 101060]|uniref:Casein kinase II beta 2 subunit n=1 Tax=Patellaria atrata CBS 101060 TaxID=1346257 RepID=A0A9P4SHB1_9PEZI|nr:hypothetical protein M501DRAFT_1013840 [Patellaria atrata CBS 101060]
MAPSAGHLHKLVAKNFKLLKHAWQKASRIAQKNLPISARQTQPQLQPAFARNARHPVHPVAALRQSKGRWYTTHSFMNANIRKFTSQSGSTTGGLKYDRSSFPKSRVASAVNGLSGRAPFASTLRPNLTGGTLGRTAGGYSLGSGAARGARYFSHTPAAPAQVVHNVSQAVRAFLIAGQKAQFDGVNPRNGEKRFKAVTKLQGEVGRKMNSLPKATPGSYIEFNVNPTITALTPLSIVAGYSMHAQIHDTLNTDGLLDILSVDFSRALKDLAIVLADLKRLSSFGDLPITYRTSSLRVHFPGCDAETVERICLELGVQRGLVIQDEDFDAFAGTEIALLFPFAPSKTASECDFLERPVVDRIMYQDPIDWRYMLTPNDDLSCEQYSTRSDTGLDFDCFEGGEVHEPYTSSPSGYESFHSSELEDASVMRERPEYDSPLEYQEFEGIYRFIEQCDSAKRR